MARKKSIKKSIIILIVGIILGGFINAYIIPIKAVKNCDEYYEEGYLQGTKDWINGVSQYDVRIEQKADTIYTKKLLP